MRVVRIIRFLALAIAAAAVLLSVVLAFNVFTQPSRQLQVAAIAKVPVDINAAAARLSQAIRFRTISIFLNPEANADALQALRAHIETSFPAFHAAASREVIAGHSLLYKWQGSDPALKPIGLLAHQDVVPIAPGTEGDWQQPPFDGVIADGYIWGRGSWDDKGNLYAIMEAAEALVKLGFRPKRTIYFAFGHDEEVAGQRGAKAIAAELARRNIRLDYVLDEGMLIMQGALKGLAPAAAMIGVAEKGYATLELNVRATPGHSSMPPSDTAIGMMAAALVHLDSNRLPLQIRGTFREMLETVAPEMSFVNRVVLSNLWLFKPLVARDIAKTGPGAASLRTTTALTIFNAGDKDNVLPGQADATVNFRLLPGDTQAGITDYVRRTIDDARITITPFPGNTDPPPLTSTTGANYTLLNKTIREVFPDVVVTPAMMTAATDSRHYTGVTDTIFRFSPVRADLDDLKRFHGTNERIGMDAYADMIRFYRRLLQNTAG